LSCSSQCKYWNSTELTAGTIIGGSTIIGNNCGLGLNCTIKQKLKIGDRSIVGSGSSMIHNVEEEDIVADSPAKSMKSKVTLEEDKLFLMTEHIRKKKLPVSYLISNNTIVC
jgi:UDP-3-O-[3-hydroxymyristoyl] glucosamine N-acyltransferase